jgi:hypothetical protein
VSGEAQIARGSEEKRLETSDDGSSADVVKLLERDETLEGRNHRVGGDDIHHHASSRTSSLLKYTNFKPSQKPELQSSRQNLSRQQSIGSFIQHHEHQKSIDIKYSKLAQSKIW